MSSSIAIFTGPAADQGCRVYNFKNYSRAADIIVKDIACDTIHDAATSADILQEHWNFSILFGKPLDKGYWDLPRAYIEYHLLVTEDDEYVVISSASDGNKYSTWGMHKTDDSDEPNTPPLSTTVPSNIPVTPATTTKPKTSLPSTPARDTKLNNLPVTSLLVSPLSASLMTAKAGSRSGTAWMLFASIRVKRWISRRISGCQSS